MFLLRVIDTSDNQPKYMPMSSSALSELASEALSLGMSFEDFMLDELGYEVLQGPFNVFQDELEVSAGDMDDFEGHA